MATLFHSSLNFWSLLSSSTWLVSFFTSRNKCLKISVCFVIIGVDNVDVEATAYGSAGGGVVLRSQLISLLNDIPLYGNIQDRGTIRGDLSTWFCTMLRSSCCSQTRKSWASFSPMRLTFLFLDLYFFIISKLLRVPSIYFFIHGGTGRKSGPMWCMFSTPTDIANEIEMRTIVLAKYWPVTKEN